MGQLQLLLLHSLLSGFLTRKGQKREGGPGSNGLTSQRVITIHVKHPYPDHPYRDGKTLGAEHDLQRLWIWPSGTLICQNLRHPPSFRSTFQGLLAAQVPSKESRSLASLGVAAVAEAKFWKLWCLKAEGGNSLNLICKAGPGSILVFQEALRIALCSDSHLG